MKSRKRLPLKDEKTAVFKEYRATITKVLDAAVEAWETKTLGGKDDSSSVKTVSGGRPESNRSKF